MSAPVLISGGEAGDPEFNDPLLPHLLDAIARCGEGSRIELCVSFIRQSGLVLLRGALHEALARGARLRVITSDYLEVTQPVALRELLKFDPARSCALIYQSQGNRGFHLKSYLFVQHAAQYLGQQVGQEGSPAVLGGQAFLGSSNISAAALTESLEWNWSLRAEPSGPSEPHHSLRQLAAQIDRLAQDARVVPLTHDWIDGYLARYRQSALRELRVLTGDHRSSAEQLREAPIPNSVQQEALMALQAARAQGHKRGVVVMATGLGKTWLAAFDVRQMQAARLLFVAHREEILTQARQTFLHMAPQANSGLYHGQQQDEADWLFASIQTLGKSRHLLRFAPDHFDYVVVDEFHHAASPSYRRLLNHFKPRFLLGLTATPDRTDQADILALCDNNLVFERGLALAIEQKMLVPLTYHGILDDTIDYAALPWRNGQFYPHALESAFASQKRAQHALSQWRRLRQQRTLAFCISTRHADFMASVFQQAGVRAIAVYAGSRQGRQAALEQLAAAELDIIFSVDLFNEGTDLPAIDTVLMLRPTESRIVFLQQLGRGLRLYQGKERLVVIDLVGNHKACLYKPQLLQTQLTYSPTHANGAMTLAAGCFINLDPKLLPLLALLKRQQQPTLLETYQILKEYLGYRPTARQTWVARLGEQLRFDTQKQGGWFELLAQAGDLGEEELRVLNRHGDFLRAGVENTVLNKSFKLILLLALLELDGLREPPTLAALASHSRYLFERHPELARLDLPAKQQALSADSPAWLSYWKSNPIKFSSGGNPGAKGEYWFEVREDRFCPRFAVSEEDIDPLHRMVQELLDLRLAQYQQRKIASAAAISPEPFTTIHDEEQALAPDAKARQVTLI